MKKLLASLAAWFFMFGMVSVASASPIDVTYTGVIDRLREGSSYLTESFFYEGLRISEGDSFTGNFSFDPNASLTGISSDGSSGVYLDAVTDFEFSTVNFSLPRSTLPVASIGGDLLVKDGLLSGWDTFYVSTWFSGSSWFSTVTIDLMDHDGSLYSDLSIPTTFDLNEFETLYFHMAFLRRLDSKQLHIYGHLSDFSVVPVSPVPEPTSILLFGTGLAGLAISRLRRSFRSRCPDGVGPSKNVVN